VLAWLRLCRLANLFTALADIGLGYLLIRGSWTPVVPFLLLLAASACLYTAGMVLNDYFDREIDAVERPKRPIPAGHVAPLAALRLGCGLLLAGVALAAAVSGASLVVALALTTFIVGYNAIIKKTPLGPLAMGTCRALNILLGASLAGTEPVGAAWIGDLSAVFTGGHVPLAVGMGLYITGVTWFARQEAETSARLPLFLALLFIDLAVAWLCWSVLSLPRTVLPAINIALVLGCVAVTLNRRALMAIQDPSPARVQGTIKIMLLSLVVFDAALALTVVPPVPYPVAILALLAPTLMLARFLAVT
jgi:4-hydroxybenzoate polyprenyltransferase